MQCSMKNKYQLKKHPECKEYEGDKLLAKTATNLRTVHAVWEAVRVWSRIWDLNKPVLVEKTPELYKLMDPDRRMGLHQALTNYSEIWPLVCCNSMHFALHNFWRQYMCTPFGHLVFLQLR